MKLGVPLPKFNEQPLNASVAAFRPSTPSCKVKCFLAIGHIWECLGNQRAALVFFLKFDATSLAM